MTNRKQLSTLVSLTDEEIGILLECLKMHIQILVGDHRPVRLVDRWGPLYYKLLDALNHDIGNLYIEFEEENP